jgi:hypothetical protein
VPEHIVLDAPGGSVRRVHHVFVYPRDEDTGEPYEELQVVGAPFAAWLDAFGLDWLGRAAAGAVHR